MGQQLTRPGRRLMLLLAFSLAVIATPAAADTRIKDIVDVENVRDNQPIGYGLEVGLNGTGDRLRHIRSDERRGGHAWVSTGRSGWSTGLKKKKYRGLKTIKE